MKRLAVGGAFLLLVAVGIAVDQVHPAGRTKPSPVNAISPGGVWGCPFIYNGSGRAWVHVANASAEASKVTVGFVREGTSTLYQTFRLAGLSAHTVPFPASERRESGAVVSYAGGDVYASRTSVFDAGLGRRGGVAAPCTRAGERTLVVPSGSTLQSETIVVVLNPTFSDAVVDISLLSNGTETQPEKLKTIVVSSMTRRKIRLGDFAFDARSVGAIVHVRTGAVTVDSLLESSRGITLSPAVVTGSNFVALGVTDSGAMLMDAVAPGDEDSLPDVSILSGRGRSAFAAIASGLAADTPATTPLGPSHEPAIGLAMRVRSGAPFAAAVRWVVQDLKGNADVSSSVAVPPSRKTVAVIGFPASGARTRILLANPGDTPATVTLGLLREGPGARSLPAVTIDPGRALAIPLGGGDGPVGVVASSDVPIGMAVAASAVGPSLFGITKLAAFAVTGLPVPVPQPAAVVRDPRLGVVAP